MSDYDYDPKEKPSAYLRLKKQGDTIRIRLASAPYRKPVVWRLDSTKPTDEQEVLQYDESDWATVYRDPDFSVNENFLWEVIDREDGGAKIFSATPGVYKSIKEFAQMEEWGDPTGYDFKIERTEEPGRNYYKVTALPNKDPLTQRDLKRLEELKFKEKEPAAKLLSERQIDYMPDAPQEYDRDTEGDSHNQAVAAKKAEQEADDEEEADRTAAAEAPLPSKPDEVITDIDEEEEIKLDDIPFGGEDNKPLNPAKPEEAENDNVKD